jgi:X-Pro dipeptidyl-peptidase-like protein
MVARNEVRPRDRYGRLVGRGGAADLGSGSRYVVKLSRHARRRAAPLYAIRLAEDGRFPVVLISDYYAAGSRPTAASKHMAVLAERGFAVVGVSVRGTACSSGVFDLFEPVWAQDLYSAVEWVARSRGRTGRSA